VTVAPHIEPNVQIEIVKPAQKLNLTFSTSLTKDSFGISHVPRNFL
jgi:hypothetical protein